MQAAKTPAVTAIKAQYLANINQPHAPEQQVISAIRH